MLPLTILSITYEKHCYVKHITEMFKFDDLIAVILSWITLSVSVILWPKLLSLTLSRNKMIIKSRYIGVLTQDDLI